MQCVKKKIGAAHMYMYMYRYLFQYITFFFLLFTVWCGINVNFHVHACRRYKDCTHKLRVSFQCGLGLECLCED